jgi:hypothetical protein
MTASLPDGAHLQRLCLPVPACACLCLPALPCAHTRVDWEGEMFCPCCEVLSLELPDGAPLPQASWGEQQEKKDDDDDDDAAAAAAAALYCDLSWASPGTLFDLVLSPLLGDLYSELNIQVQHTAYIL